MPGLSRTTKDRVIAAASALFAERGFRGTTVRDIAQRARVNLAAAHYHFGSKESLYLEVLRVQFAGVMIELGQRGARPGAGPTPLPEAALRTVLRTRIAAMLELLLGPPPGSHGTLMMREMCDPSAALPDIVELVIQPLKRDMEAIVGGLLPKLGSGAIERCVFSIVAQVLFYRQMLPALQRMIGPGIDTRPWQRATAEHIAEFSLGGLRHIGRRRRGARPTR